MTLLYVQRDITVLFPFAFCAEVGGSSHNSWPGSQIATEHHYRCVSIHALLSYANNMRKTPAK